jgi:hypothetical protein
MRTILRFLRSIPLAVTLILVLVFLSIFATLVTGFTDFFHSILFFAPAALFTLSLATCTATRLVRRARTRAPLRLGPDLIHVGLLLLIAGGLLTFATRREQTYTLKEGDSARITSSYTVTVLSLECLKYTSGDPKAWISTIKVTHDGKEEVPSFPIAMNRPLRLPGITLYQYTFASLGTLYLKDAQGKVYAMEAGQGFEADDYVFSFNRTERLPNGAWYAVFSLAQNGKTAVSRMAVTPGMILGPFTAERVEGILVTGLHAVSDPGALPVFIALALIGAGLALTFIQRRKDEDPRDAA